MWRSRNGDSLDVRSHCSMLVGGAAPVVVVVVVVAVLILLTWLCRFAQEAAEKALTERFRLSSKEHYGGKVVDWQAIDDRGDRSCAFDLHLECRGHTE